MAILKTYFRKLYQQTMQEAYSLAHDEILDALLKGGNCLDCGAQKGHKYHLLHRKIGLKQSLYHGIEWDVESVEEARRNDLNVLHGDLNRKMNFANDSFRCIFGLSVLEHLLNPCSYLKECYRCLEKDGTLILLTPNISTYFTMVLLLAGKMPSSGPHPDSDVLIAQGETFKVSTYGLVPDSETDTPLHRHLVVFSYRVLQSYLELLGFKEIKGYGFGLYPFPNFIQPLLERVDPWHCHQMVFTAKKEVSA